MYTVEIVKNRIYKGIEFPKDQRYEIRFEIQYTNDIGEVVLTDEEGGKITEGFWFNRGKYYQVIPKNKMPLNVQKLWDEIESRKKVKSNNPFSIKR